MTIFRRAPAGLVASGVFVLGLFYAAGPASADDGARLMFINAKTNKCLTIAGGLSTANNVEAVQFDCDSDTVAPLAPDQHRAPGRHLPDQEQTDQQVPDYCRGREHRQQRDGSSVRLRQRSVAHLDDQAVCDSPVMATASRCACITPTQRRSDTSILFNCN